MSFLLAFETFDISFAQKDVLLICSNAMQYNSADTIYYRQVWLCLNSVTILYSFASVISENRHFFI
jgi:hypothetical protein